MTDPTKETEITWNSPRYDTYEFVALNLDCTNTTSSSNSSSDNSTVKSFTFTVSGTFLNNKETHPHLSIEYMHCPEMFLGALLWTLLMLAVCGACVHFMRARALAKRAACGDFLHTEGRLRYLLAFAASLVLTFIGCTVSYAFWKSFAGAGVENRYTLYFGKLFLASGNAITMFAMYLWVTNSNDGSNATTAAAAKSEKYYIVAVGALVFLGSFFFEFYRSSDPGWSTAVLIFMMVALFANPLLNMAEAHVRNRISGVGPSSRHERASLINSNFDEKDDDENENENEEKEEGFRNEFKSSNRGFGVSDRKKLFARLSNNFDALVPTPTWIPWATAVLLVAIIYGFWSLLPDILPWYFKWLQFQPYGQAGICVGLSVVIMEHTAARPPPRFTATPSQEAQNTAIPSSDNSGSEDTSNLSADGSVPDDNISF